MVCALRVERPRRARYEAGEEGRCLRLHRGGGPAEPHRVPFPRWRDVVHPHMLVLVLVLVLVNIGYRVRLAVDMSWIVRVSRLA